MQFFERFYSLSDSVLGSFPHLHHLGFQQTLRGPVKEGSVACPLSFDLTLSLSLSSLSSSSRALTYYVVAITSTSLDAPSPLSRCAAASIATPPPLSPHQRLSHCASLAPAVGCYIVTSLAAPVPLFSCRRLSRCSATSLVAPPPLL